MRSGSSCVGPIRKIGQRRHEDDGPPWARRSLDPSPYFQETRLPIIRRWGSGFDEEEKDAHTMGARSHRVARSFSVVGRVGVAIVPVSTRWRSGCSSVIPIRTGWRECEHSRPRPMPGSRVTGRRGASPNDRLAVVPKGRLEKPTYFVHFRSVLHNSDRRWRMYPAASRPRLSCRDFSFVRRRRAAPVMGTNWWELA